MRAPPLVPIQVEPRIEELIGRMHAVLSREIVADPSLLEDIPDGAALVLLPDGADEEFVEANVALGLDSLRKGRGVYFKRLAPGEWGIGAAGPTTEPHATGAASEQRLVHRG